MTHIVTGSADDTANYQPPTMHVGEDGLHMTSQTMRINGGDHVQVTYSADVVDDDDDWEAIRRMIRHFEEKYGS